jgi:hypothetical protein
MRVDTDRIGVQWPSAMVLAWLGNAVLGRCAGA